MPLAGAESRWWRRLGRSFVSADSYGLVLLLVVVTYVVSVSVTETWAASIVLTVQLATVWLTLRTSQARRVTRLVADIVLCLAAVVAVVSLFAHKPGGQLGGIFTVCCLLYLIAPFSIVRHLMLRREIDTETLLGAIAAYLLIGMFFAFAYKAAGEFGSVPFFGSAGPRLAQPGPVLQLRHDDHRRVREPGAGRQPRADVRGAGGGDRAAVPRRGRREDHQQPAAPARRAIRLLTLPSGPCGQHVPACALVLGALASAGGDRT